jgi:hypothetical protein
VTFVARIEAIVRLWAALSCFGLPEPALAGDVPEGEVRRLTEEMYAYAQRNVWTAAERSFRQLDALGPTLTASDLFLGATAARTVGDARACQERLLRAFQLGLAPGESLDPRATEWLAEIQTNYGRVVLTAKKPATLQAVSPPFQPDRQAAIVHAAGMLEQDRRFEGLLPAGEYRYGRTTWTVDADMVQVQTRKLKP